jgi:ubiquinol-cytochrome c reductase cytochrome c1 subunit
MTKRYFGSIALALSLLLASVASQAQEGESLPASGTNVFDQASLQRGAKLFFNYCVGCHSLKYQRYARVAEDLGLSEQDVMSNLNFTGAKFGEPVISQMPAEVAQQAFGKVPPDLSLEVRAKSADWVYAYLNSFYLDPSRPVGWNNTVFANASMPNPLWELQGLQVAVKAPGSDAVERLKLQTMGTLNPEQFRAATRDLTAFLEYVSEPAVLQRHHYGLWVLLFLCLFTFLAYMLKREYWKDVH